jgi:transposase
MQSTVEITGGPNARTIRQFTGWHYHPEFEIHLIRRSSGLCYVGTHVGPFGVGDLVKCLTKEAVDRMGFPEEVALAIQSNVAVIGVLDGQIERLEKRLQGRVGKRREYDLLTGVPGIGQTLATDILLEVGTIERFGGVGQLASYARCVDRVHGSNGKKKGEGKVRNGNKYLAWAFIEAAHFAQRYCQEAKRFYERKKSRTNTAVEIKALAHKLARACYLMLKEEKPFDVKRCFA